MGVEIERKFLLSEKAGYDAWRLGVEGVPYAQGYLSRGTGRTVRVRIAGAKAFLTIKGPVTGISRTEFEYEIPVADARQLLPLCDGPVIEKIRHKIPHGRHIWEVDEFLGENAGLVLAEVELADEGDAVEMPVWIGREVTGDPRYYNSNLTVHPYRLWRYEAP
ncbi:MAG: CYTH domain-containing protein [Verrucomicrobia bacterium]|nr:CYTH domain-containing protein [Verrucomicrobiota bacterium]